MQTDSAWDRWKALAARAATFQARVLLALFYWFFVTPFALVLRVVADPLELRGSEGGRWHQAPPTHPFRPS